MFTIWANGRLLLTLSHRGGRLLLTKMGIYQSQNWDLLLTEMEFVSHRNRICC